MKKYFYFILSFYFLVAPDWVYPFQSIHKNSDKTISQFSLSYWNDNFLFENWLNDLLPEGKDDFVTAGFGVQYSTGKKEKYWVLDFYLYNLTNKSQNYRADLFTSLLSKKCNFTFGYIQTGFGTAWRGNFGGSEIQNGYHDIFGYRKVKIPYLRETKLGLILHAKFGYRFVKKANLKILGNFESNYISAAAPAKMYCGFNLEYLCFISFQVDAGYVYYYKTDRWLRQLFDQGFTLRFLTAKDLKNRLCLSLWFSKGQYGIEDDFHFGLIFKIAISKKI